MNQILNEGLIASIKHLYESDDNVRSLLEELGGRVKDQAETTAARASKLTGAAYYEMVAAMKALEGAGAGTFIAGRKGNKTRIAWEYSTRSLAAAARGEGNLAEMESDAVIEDDEQSEAIDAAEGDVIHEFLLRPGRKVRLSLPENLTDREAERLGTFIKALPYEDQWL